MSEAIWINFRSFYHIVSTRIRPLISIIGSSYSPSLRSGIFPTSVNNLLDEMCYEWKSNKNICFFCMILMLFICFTITVILKPM